GKAVGTAGASSAISSAAPILASIKMKVAVLIAVGALTVGGTLAYKASSRPTSGIEQQKLQAALAKVENVLPSSEQARLFFEERYELPPLEAKEREELMAELFRVLKELDEEANPEASLQIIDNQVVALQSLEAHEIIGKYIYTKWPQIGIIMEVFEVTDMAEVLKQHDIQATPQDDNNGRFSLTKDAAKKLYKTMRSEDKVLFAPRVILHNGQKSEMKVSSNENPELVYSQLEVTSKTDRHNQYITTDFDLTISRLDHVTDGKEIPSIDQLSTSLITEPEQVILFLTDAERSNAPQKWIMLRTVIPSHDEGNVDNGEGADPLLEDAPEIF
ncbi:MAG: hypothetical protein JXA52_08780, partial [Planctomycetes bacterium]|nr:hypothetical protein [Planctomycetota bacterium]